MAKWYAFKAYNSRTVYAYGSASEADRYADHINKGKEINLYAPYEVSDDEAEELSLEERSDTFGLYDVLCEIDD